MTHNDRVVARELKLLLGVKSDPIEYRYSFEWLFDIMASEGVPYLQLGTFFEIYQLPDVFFNRLRASASERGLEIRSVFTSHRELGGFYREDGPGWAEVAMQNYRRLIEIGSLVGAQSVGCNPGAVLRDQMASREVGTQTYVTAMKQLMHYAHRCGVPCLTIEPMSCLAEPPTLPSEITNLCGDLHAYHEANADTAAIGLCADVSHGYVNETGQTIHDNFELLEASLPWIREIHLRNTDASYSGTFGFGRHEMAKGIVEPSQVREFLIAHADALPTDELVGYLEIPGPKLGRDSTDPMLETALRGSLRGLKASFLASPPNLKPSNNVLTSASIMCADVGYLASEVRRLERCGVDMIHVDIMDANFVPNMPIGLGLVARLRELTHLPLDVHLMVRDNAFFIEKLAAIGVDRICVHAETATHLQRLLATIRSQGVLAGVALNPATPLDVLEYVTADIDFVLLMTVNPGFAGQDLVPSALRKIADLSSWLCSRNLKIPIEVDGNVNFDNIPKMVASGADILVLGSSSLFSSQNGMSDNMSRIRTGAEEGLGARQ